MTPEPAFREQPRAAQPRGCGYGPPVASALSGWGVAARSPQHRSRRLVHSASPLRGERSTRDLMSWRP